MTLVGITSAFVQQFRLGNLELCRIEEHFLFCSLLNLDYFSKTYIKCRKKPFCYRQSPTIKNQHDSSYMLQSMYFSNNYFVV